MMKDGGAAFPVKYFKLYWLNGETNIVSGVDIATAMNNAGYGAGALRALDYYKEVAEDAAREGEDR